MISISTTSTPLERNNQYEYMLDTDMNGYETVPCIQSLRAPSASTVLCWHLTGKKGPRTAFLKEPTLNICTAEVDGNTDTDKFAFHFVKLVKIWSIAVNILLETDPFPGRWLLLHYVTKLYHSPERVWVDCIMIKCFLIDVNCNSRFNKKTLSPLVSPQAHWRWLFRLSQCQHILVTLPCCAVRSRATRLPSSGGRRTGRTSRWPLTLTPAWQRCHPARCRSAASSHLTRPHTAVWLTTLAVPGQERTRSCGCSQVTE